MDQAYIRKAQREIQKWETEGPGLLSQFTEFVFSPAQKMAVALVPSAVRRAVSHATYDLLLRMGSVTQFLTDSARIYRRVDAAYRRHGDELRAADAAARHYRRKSVAYAAGEGSLSGAVGFVGLAADIPAVLMIAIRLIRQIGTCYGYDVDSAAEREHALHVLRLGSASSLKAKMEFLAGLKEVQGVLVRLSVSSAAERLATSQLSRLSVLRALRQFAERLGLQLTTRKALELVPVAGAVIGGSFNAMFVNDIGHAAYMTYRRRRIVEAESLDTAMPGSA
jgi:uncharacterized protein (DUF697 family)